VSDTVQARIAEALTPEIRDWWLLRRGGVNALAEHIAEVLTSLPGIVIVERPADDGSPLMPPETLVQRMKADGRLSKIAFAEGRRSVAGGES
jgi:hypothetical protein